MLKKLISQHNKNTVVIESHAQSQAAPKTLFYYHLRRTGGLSFSNAFITAHENLYKFLCHESGQSVSMRNVARVDERAPALMDLMGYGFSFIVGHVDYGLHKILKSKADLMTIVRDPVKRITSEYTRACMLAGKPVDEEDFLVFVRSPENTNGMTRQLHPEAYLVDVSQITAADLYSRKKTPTADFRAVIHNLETNFQAYGTSARIYELLEFYASVFKLPNIIMETLNKTSSPYQLDSTEFADEIMELNREDQFLYDYILAHPRIPKHSGNNELSRLTVVMKALNDRDEVATESNIYKTADVVQMLNKDPEKYSNVETYFD